MYKTSKTTTTYPTKLIIFKLSKLFIKKRYLQSMRYPHLKIIKTSSILFDSYAD